MAFRKLTGLLLAAFISTIAHADELAINPTHPDQYTVVYGDTLWGISGKFLQHPYQWPELWRTNSQIQNPNRIYPGDTIYFSMVNGKPQLSLSRSGGDDQPVGNINIQSPCVLQEDDSKHGRSLPSGPEGKLTPCIRVSNLDQAIDLIPHGKIASFLNSPRVVNATELNSAPYVVSVAGEHLIAGGPGDKLYVRSILTSNVQNFTVYRAGETYKNPETGEILGYEARYIGEAVLKKPGDPASLEVIKATTEILVTDRLMPNPEESITLDYFPRPPTKKILGHILSVPGGVTEIGNLNVVVIDKGAKDGLQVGHELDIYKAGKLILDRLATSHNGMVRLPDEKAGTLMIFRTFERVSYALVMNTTMAVHVLDKVETP